MLLRSFSTLFLTFLKAVIFSRTTFGQIKFAPNTGVNISVNRIYPCTGPKPAIGFNMTCKKLTRSVTTYSGYAHLPFAVGAGFKATFGFGRWSDGGWKYNAVNIEYDDPCKGANKFFGKLWHDLERLCVPPILPPGRCPVPAGHYVLNNYTFNLDDLSFRPPFLGRWLLAIKMYTIADNVLQFCHNFDVDIIAKIPYQKFLREKGKRYSPSNREAK